MHLLDEKAIVYANGIGIDDIEFDRIFTNIANSIRPDGKGLGINASFHLAPMIIVSSKKGGKYYGAKYVLNEEGEFIYDTNEINPQNQDYLEATNKIMNFNTGSAWMLVNIGKCRVPRYDFRFEIKNQFDDLEQTLSNEFHSRLQTGSFELYFSKDSEKSHKVSHNKTKLYGKQIVRGGFSYNREFLENDKKYILEVNFQLYKYSGEIVICCNGMDPLDLREEGLRRKVGGLLRNDDIYGKHLSGYVDFTIKATHKQDPIPDFYIGSRTHLRWNSGWGDAFANIWLEAQEDKLKPALEDYLSEKENKKYDKICSSLAISLNECLKDEEIRDLFNVAFNTDKTKDETNKPTFKLKCKECGSDKVDTSLSSRIHRCRKCGFSWPMITVATPVRNPIDIKTYTDQGYSVKDREKQKGHIGISIRIWRDPNLNTIANCIGSQVFINSNHKYFKENEKKNERERKQYLVNIAILAYVHETCKDNKVDEYNIALRFIAIYANRYYDKVSVSEYTTKSKKEEE